MRFKEYKIDTQNKGTTKKVIEHAFVLGYVKNKDVWDEYEIENRRFLFLYEDGQIGRIRSSGNDCFKEDPFKKIAPKRFLKLSKNDVEITK